MYYTYAISSLAKPYIYVGMTSNIERRFSEHQSGHNKTTKPYRPYKLIYTAEHDSRMQARENEKYLKSGAGKEFLKQLIG